MADYLPPIVTKLDGDVSGLARSFTEAKAMADEYGQHVEDTVAKHSEQAGERGGEKLTETFEERASQGIERLRDSRGRFRSKFEESVDDIGDKGGQGLASRLWNSFLSNSESGIDSISGKAPQGLIQWLVAGAAAAAPAIGAAIDAGVLTAVGGGSIALGLVAAAKDPRVGAAWKSSFEDIWGEFQRASEPFIKPLVAEAGEFHDLIEEAMPAIEAGFQRAEPYVERIFGGLNQMIREIGPAWGRAFDASLPVLDELGTVVLPAIGRGVSNFLDSMARGGPGAVQFMHDFGVWAEFSLTYLGFLVEKLSQLYAFARSDNPFSAFLTGTGNLWMDLIDHTDKSGKSFQKLKKDAEDAAGGMDKAKKSASDFIAEALKMQDSDLALARGLQDVTRSFEQNGHSIDTTTEKGLANRSALQSQIETIAQHRQSLFDQGKATAYVNDWTYKAIQAMRDAAVAHGGDKGAIDALIEAWRVMLGLPSQKNFQVTTRYVVFGDEHTGTAGGRLRVAYKHGGFTGPLLMAQSGLLTSGGITREQQRPQIMTTEPGTGQEGIVPRYGITDDRFYDLVSEIASWRGMSVSGPGGGVPAFSGAGSRPGGQQVQPIVVQFVVDGQVLQQANIQVAQRHKAQNISAGTGLT